MGITRPLSSLYLGVKQIFSLIDYTDVIGGSATPPTVGQVFSKAADTISSTLFVLGPAILVAMVVYGGILMLTSGSNADSYAKGMKTIQWAAIGFAVSVAGFLIVRIATSIIGFDVGSTATINL